MYKILRADKDTYITDRVIKGVRVHSGNVGAAGSLDLFKLYGHTFSGSVPNIELSRILIHFDLDPLRDLVAAGKVDITNPSFSCLLKLFDVYGGQPTPTNFTVTISPLSRSFDEGLGRDVVYYGDNDSCNFLTGSRTQGIWLLSGCGQGGGLPGTVDYITASTAINAGTSLVVSNDFITGDEDLSADVTTIVSATLAGLLPDEGYRIALDSTHEVDSYSYFVKRFGARTAFNGDKRPQLVVRFDDSVQDDSTSLTFDSSGSIFLYNQIGQRFANLLSGSALTPITGSNSLILKMQTEISGGHYTLVFTGSQHRRGMHYVTGAYSASVFLPSTDSTLRAKLIASGNVKFKPIWGSLDGTLAFLTGSSIIAYPPSRGPSAGNKRFVVNAMVRESYATDEETMVRVNIFDHTSPLIQIVRVPTILPGIVIRDVHYRVRDAATNNIAIPFDTIKNSTRLSSDDAGMFFMLDTSNLTEDRSYIIDVLIVTAGHQETFKAASSAFRVSDLR